MAGRARTIKPEILDDEKTAQLSHLEWRLFVSLWLMADDYGNLRSEPAFIASHALWAARETPEVVRDALDELADVGLVQRYIVRGQGYLTITNWGRHQKISHPSRPQMPGSEDAVNTGASTLRSGPEDAGNTLTRTLRRVSGESPESLGGSPERLRRDSGGSSASSGKEDPPEGLRRVSGESPETLSLERRGEERIREREASRAAREEALSLCLPVGWDPDTDPEARKIATDRGLDLKHEISPFRDHAAIAKVTSADWNASCRKWLRGSRDTGRNSAASDGASMALAPKQTRRILERTRKGDGSAAVLEHFPDGNAEYKTDDEITELQAEGLL